MEAEPVQDSAVDEETIRTSRDWETNQLDESDKENLDPVDKIKKAKDLLDIGAITQEEFEQIKNKYLERI